MCRFPQELGAAGRRAGLTLGRGCMGFVAVYFSTGNNGVVRKRQRRRGRGVLLWCVQLFSVLYIHKNMHCAHMPAQCMFL